MAKRAGSPERKANSRSPAANPNAEKVKDYRHEEKRPNNPPAGLATYDHTLPSRKIYDYDPHLDPQLVWAGKKEHTSFGAENVALHIHERISTAAIIKAVQREPLQRDLFADPQFPLTQQIEFYQHEMNWANRLILGDSLLVMNSLLERELMAGKVQMIYMDPPYGVSYKSNFQPTTRKPDPSVQDKDENLSREPEMIKAYRDTWTLGVHSYLTYMRDRLLLCKELLSETGSIFIQISDVNLHHVRELLDELFGSENLFAVIPFRKGFALAPKGLGGVCDFILWYAKNKELVKYRQIFKEKIAGGEGRYNAVELSDGTRRRMTKEEREDLSLLPGGSKPFVAENLLAAGLTPSCVFEFEFEGKKYRPKSGRSWKTNPHGMARLIEQNRIVVFGDSPSYVLYHEDYPVAPLDNLWSDTGGASDPIYVVQTATKIVERCMLMSTEAGELVLDPTCGSGPRPTLPSNGGGAGSRWTLPA